MNLKEYLKERKIKPYQFALEAGIRYETAYDLADGKRPNLEAATIRKILLASGGKIAIETLI